MEFTIHLQILGIVFFTGMVMGAVVKKTDFCTMGAVSDWVNMGDTGRLRSWLLAIAVATIGVVVLEASGKVAIGTSTFPPYRTPNLAWLRYLLGGLMFGIGMTLASGCGNKTLVRIGGGNLKSVVVLAIASACAYAMLWTDFYDTVFGSLVSSTTINLAAAGKTSQALGDLTGLGNTIVGLVLALALMGLFSRRVTFAAASTIFWAGVVIGIAVIVGWYVTGRLDGRGLEGVCRFCRRQAVARGNAVLHLHEPDGRPGALCDESGRYVADQLRHHGAGWRDRRLFPLRRDQPQFSCRVVRQSRRLSPITRSVRC